MTTQAEKTRARMAAEEISRRILSGGFSTDDLERIISFHMGPQGAGWVSVEEPPTKAGMYWVAAIRANGAWLIAEAAWGSTFGWDDLFDHGFPNQPPKITHYRELPAPPGAAESPSGREAAVEELIRAAEAVTEDYRPMAGGGNPLMDALRSAVERVRKGTP